LAIVWVAAVPKAVVVPRAVAVPKTAVAVKLSQIEKVVEPTAAVYAQEAMAGSSPLPAILVVEATAEIPKRSLPVALLPKRLNRSLPVALLPKRLNRSLPVVLLPKRRKRSLQALEHLEY
jgi:hypothetical protein